MDNVALFNIENVDLDNGQVVVRFINKYGPIYTNKKTIEDFTIEVEVPGDEIAQDGTRSIKKEKVLTTNNPNDDLIYSIDIPFDENNNYVSETKLLENIAIQYPTEQFEIYNKKQNVLKDKSLENIVGKRYEVEIKYPENDSIGMANDGNADKINII